jgi:translation elongation factor P/translation initiation factor 5A
LKLDTHEQIEIPIRNIRGVDLNESQKKKMTIIIEDSSEFLFMDFLRYDKARQNLEEAILWQSCQAEGS